MKPILSCLLIALALFALRPGTAFAASANLDRIEPLADEYTVLVVRLDFASVDVDATIKFALDLMPADLRDEASTQASAIGQAAKAWLGAFREAGGREIYLLFSLSDLGSRQPFVIAVPLSEGADPAKLQTSLRELDAFEDPECRTLHGCLVEASKTTQRRLEDGGPGSPPHLRTAFAAVPNGVIQAVVLPYEGSSQLIENTMPTLPRVVGGGPSTTFTRGLLWAAASVQAPPAVATVVSIKSQSEADATALLQAIKAALHSLGHLPEVRDQLPEWSRIEAALTPAVAGDSLVLKLDRARITQLARSVLVPALAEARGNAQRILMINNLRQIALALIMYSEEHDRRLPLHLADALAYLGSPQPLLRPDDSTRPPPDLMERDREARVAWVDRHAAVTYVRGGAHLRDIASPAEAVLAYATPRSAQEPQVLVVFADGHAESVPRQRFEELLEQVEAPVP